MNGSKNAMIGPVIGSIWNHLVPAFPGQKHSSTCQKNGGVCDPQGCVLSGQHWASFI